MRSIAGVKRVGKGWTDELRAEVGVTEGLSQEEAGKEVNEERMHSGWRGEGEEDRDRGGKRDLAGLGGERTQWTTGVKQDQ